MHSLTDWILLPSRRPRRALVQPPRNHAEDVDRAASPADGSTFMLRLNHCTGKSSGELDKMSHPERGSSFYRPIQGPEAPTGPAQVAPGEAQRRRGNGAEGAGHPEAGARKKDAAGGRKRVRCSPAGLDLRAPRGGASFPPAYPERRYASLRATRGGPFQGRLSLGFLSWLLLEIPGRAPGCPSFRLPKKTIMVGSFVRLSRNMRATLRPRAMPRPARGSLGAGIFCFGRPVGTRMLP